MKKEVDSEKELERVKNTFKSFRIFMVLLDILAITILIIQIKMNDVAYYSYVLLVVCNLIVFLIRPEKIISVKKTK